MLRIGPYTVVNEKGYFTTRRAEDFYDFMWENNFSKHLSVKIPKNPKILGIGTQGVAFKLNAKLSLKVTEDESEAKVATLLTGRRKKGLYKTFDVFYTEEWDRKLYLIVMETLKDSKKSDDITEAFTEDLIYEFSSWMKDADDPNRPGWAGIDKSNWWDSDSKIESLKKYFSEMDDFPQKYKDGFLDIAYGLRNLNKMKIVYGDLWAGNVLERPNGHLVLIDLGYSKGGSGNIKSIDEYKDEYGRPSAAKRGYDHSWRKLRKEIIKRDKGKCVYCGEDANEVDHIKPLSRGGKNIHSNLRLLCGKCHRQKTKRYDCIK